MAVVFSRIAVTAPPKAWFHGISYAHYEIYRRALADLGAKIFDVPVDAFLPPDAGRIANLIDDLRAFRPELAIGLPYLSCALLCRTEPERDGWQSNLFTDLLDVPVLGAWDHAPLELADQLLTPHPSVLAKSSAGTMAQLRRSLTDPRLIHWSRDSGQTKIMCELGFLPSVMPIQQTRPALPTVLHPMAASGSGPNVAFIGHVYQEAPVYPDPALTVLASRAVNDWLDHGGTMWDALRSRIAMLPVDVRNHLALDPDQSFFWGFAHQLVLHRAQTARRLAVLGAAGVPVVYYGNLQSKLPGVPANLVALPEHVPFGAPLATMLARHPITVDVTSPGFVNTVSQKVLLALNAGGFVLVDHKRDFIGEFGDLAEAVSYTDGADLAAKIDLYLSRPKLRREVGDAFRARINQSHLLPDVLARVLDQAAERVRVPARPRRAEKATTSGVSVLGKMRICNSDKKRFANPFSLPRLRRSAKGVMLTTQTHAWHYAAEIVLSHPVAGTRKRYLHLIMQVEARQFSVVIFIANTRPLVGERFIGPSRRPVAIDIELPHDHSATIIFRSAVAGPSRALIISAKLSDCA